MRSRSQASSCSSNIITIKPWHPKEPPAALTAGTQAVLFLLYRSLLKLVTLPAPLEKNKYNHFREFKLRAASLSHRVIYNSVTFKLEEAFFSASLDDSVIS